MGLFGALLEVATLPVRVAVDTVKMPVKIMNGEDGLLENTSKGLGRIEGELDD